ncbi:mas-related G-protein coupled receptor member H-like [Hemicordylus capensis]|uniref:mas-related G-protein coupled receptor member H-like n=1 Tax=Hemicordylus capensis TaxID=884348 RepID=UPI0023023709|nr:mas-related G-protein coupled receptor member H-like [Hemicordylus capensis]
MEYNTTSKETWNSVNESYPTGSRGIYTGYNIKLSLSITIGVVCIFGLVGNGTVIWLLGFRIKRNPFTTYILNLSVADFGLLISLPWMSLVPMFFTYDFIIIYNIFFTVFYSIGQLLLTAISVDRCVSVLFPIWYRCHRPPRLSTFVCAFIWVLSSVFNGIPTILNLSGNMRFLSIYFQLLINASLCLPLITISTLILFIRVCFKSRQHRRARILMVVLLTLLFYLFFAFPLNAVFLITYHSPLDIFRYLWECMFLTTSLNSSVNPFIYFFIGKKKRSHSRESVKVILQRVFKEEEAPEAEEEPPLENQL